MSSEPSESTPDAIVAAARRNDATASIAIATMAHWLGHIAAVAAAVTNPDTIVIGGGLGVAAFDLLREDAQRELTRRLPPSYRGDVRLRVATLASPAVGAASLVWSRQSTHGAVHENAG
jgi:predicted NBD/HSP70 family sugar kinase